VAGQNPDAILAHLTGGMGDDFMIIVELHTKSGVGQELGDRTLEFKQFFLRHEVPWLVNDGATHEPVAEQNQAWEWPNPKPGHEFSGSCTTPRGRPSHRIGSGYAASDRHGH